MLTCNACMKHCLQTIVGDSIILSPRPTISATLPRRPLRRSYTTAVFQPISIGASRQAGHGSSHKGRDGERRDGMVFRGDVSVEEGRTQWLKSRGVTPSHKRKAPTDEDFVIRKHLAYLKDPLKLAEFTRNTLRSNDYETALQVVRAASKNMQCIVSWNHLVDYQLEQKKMNGAMKIYNEMKKRAQIPDAYTYTIIFRGCAAHPDSEHALEKCLVLYQSMLLEKSPVKPNVIHINALLKMCARANNVEAMFAIASSLDSKSIIGQPNNLTFTTILNGLRMSTIIDGRSAELTPMQKRENVRKAIWEARKTWARAVTRWRKGDIWIDEELVASMGRVLLLGEKQDVDDVLSLVEQAMNIPRQIPSMIKRPLEEPILSSTGFLPNQSTSEVATSEGAELSNKASEDTLEETEVLPELFVAGAVPKTSVKVPSAYAKLGPNTLSLLMSACLALKSKEGAKKYWKIFTENGVKPDVENYHAYLRILRMTRSSSEALQVLLSMHQQDLQHKTFRIAMSACERDKLNPNVFANAGKILDLMQMIKLRESYIPVLISYLEVALDSPVYSKTKSSIGQNEYSPTGQGNQILRALERLEPFITNFRSMIFITNPGFEGKRNSDRDQILADFVLLVRRMIGACDQLIHKGLATKDQANVIKAHRARLAAMVSRPRLSGVKNLSKATTLVPADWAAEVEEDDVDSQEASKGTAPIIRRNGPPGRRFRDSDALSKNTPTWGTRFQVPERSSRAKNQGQ